jgi:hypothetical protein
MSSATARAAGAAEAVQMLEKGWCLASKSSRVSRHISDLRPMSFPKYASNSTLTVSPTGLRSTLQTRLACFSHSMQSQLLRIIAVSARFSLEELIQGGQTGLTVIPPLFLRISNFFGIRVPQYLQIPLRYGRQCVSPFASAGGEPVCIGCGYRALGSHCRIRPLVTEVGTGKTLAFAGGPREGTPKCIYSPRSEGRRKSLSRWRNY